MSKIYKDYEDKYVANNVVYTGYSSEMNYNASAKKQACLASVTPTRDSSGGIVSATRIGKDSFIDLFRKGAIICVDPEGTMTKPTYYTPDNFGIDFRSDVYYAYAAFTNKAGDSVLVLSEEAYDLDLRTFTV